MTATLQAVQALDVQLREIMSDLDAFGLKREELVANEKRDSVAIFKENWSPAQLSLAKLQDLIARCRDSLVISFQSGGFELDWSATEQGLERLAERAQRLGSVTLALTLNKARLLEVLDVQPPQAAVQLFLHGDALVRMLAVPLAGLEGKGNLLEHATGARKVLILVADRDLSLDGGYLAVAGGRFLQDWPSYCSESPPGSQPLEDLYAKALDPASELSRIGFSLSYLTPLQLRVEWKDGPAAPAVPPCEDPVVQALQQKRVEIALAYTANQVQETRKEGQWEWLCTYQRDSASGQIRLRGCPDPSTAEVAKSLPAAARILDELSTWAYAREDRESDRLPILRAVFADALSDRKPEANYRLLVEDTGRLARDVKGGWNSFVSGKLEEYFARVRQLEELVDGTLQSFQGQVQALIKSLSESMLAGVGVVVGSFLAAMFGSSFNANVFRLGTLLYAFYLAVFPGLIGLTSNRLQARDAAQAFRLRVQSFRDRLSESVVDDITKEGQIAEGVISRFDTWFAFAVAIYAVIVLALLLGAYLVPKMFAAS